MSKYRYQVFANYLRILPIWRIFFLLLFANFGIHELFLFLFLQNLALQIYSYSKSKIVTKLKVSDIDKTKKLKLWQNSKTQILPNSKTQIVTKLKNSTLFQKSTKIWDKTQNLDDSKFLVKTTRTHWQPMRCSKGNVLQFSQFFLSLTEST